MKFSDLRLANKVFLLQLTEKPPQWPEFEFVGGFVFISFWDFLFNRVAANPQHFHQIFPHQMYFKR